MNTRNYQRTIIYILLFSFFCTGISAQYKLADARSDLQKLKSGMLLVRLKTREASIAALEKMDRHKEAEQLREKQYRENKETILSFSQAFNFCPVYFFYSDASNLVRMGKLQGQIFNSQLELVDADELGKPFFTAEFSETENLGIHGLILMDDHLIPLQAPFPFFQREYTFFGMISLSKAKMVERYNSRLYGTYSLWFSDEP